MSFGFAGSVPLARRLGTRSSLQHSADSLAGLADVVRGVLVARTNDQHLIEDLTQETLARMLTAEHRLSIDEQRAYAIVTARNLLVSHARSQSVGRRHLHRLVDDTDPDGPERGTLEREETDALAAALEQLDPADRELLLRHESDDADLATLADEAQSTTGAVAMRLARARAVLRLEFLLAFRRVELPTKRCRPVLLALSTGDRRRQAQLDVAGHLGSCATCAELAEPVRERDRRIAGWLLLPFGDSIRRAWRRVWNGPIFPATVALLATVATVSLIGPEPDRAASPAPRPAVEAPTVTTVAGGITSTGITSTTLPVATATVTTAATTAVTTTTVTAGQATPTSTTAPCVLPAGIEPLDPAAALICPVATTVVAAVEDAVSTTVAVTVPTTLPLGVGP